MPENNLFPIDLDSIELKLSEANSATIEKHNNLIESIELIPDQINADTEAVIAQNTLRELSALSREWREARLADGRPFANATKLVKQWFSKFEDRLKSKEIHLKRLLGDFALSQQIQEPEVKEDIEEKKGLWQKLKGRKDDEPNLETESSKEDSNNESKQPVDVLMKWQIMDFDRSEVPIEELREHLTEHCIRNALEKHLKINGPEKKLQGVNYEQVVI